MNDYYEDEDEEEIDSLDGAAYSIGVLLIMFGMIGLFICWLLA